jgi:prepilin-type N-terminal cleavage/methylation domain-containing protein
VIEKLRSHLKQEKGFTLVELLIVIAIIAILVIIALIAIDPIQRIHDANDRAAASDVRQVATAFEGCVARNNADVAVCDTQGEMNGGAAGAPWVRNWPTGVDTSLPFCKNGGAGHSWSYNTTTGSVEEDTGGAC